MRRDNTMQSITCPNCKRRLKIKPRTHQKKCKCGNTINITRTDGKCAFGCGTIVRERHSICVKCENKYPHHSVDVALLDRFSRALII
jgi:hypothetical protein